LPDDCAASKLIRLAAYHISCEIRTKDDFALSVRCAAAIVMITRSPWFAGADGDDVPDHDLHGDTAQLQNIVCFLTDIEDYKITPVDVRKSVLDPLGATGAFQNMSDRHLLGRGMFDQ
jgi:hypothetical protein